MAPKTPDIGDQGAKKTILELHGYQLGKTLGHGSYATVKKGYSSKHKCPVAIKIISKRRTPKAYSGKFLARELDTVKLLKHPNLIVFLQAIETNRHVYLIMECANGGDLTDRVRKGPIPEDKAGIWFSQLLDGVEYCHKKGVVHRDLKCENLLLDEKENLKICDFGFSRCDMSPIDGQYILSETHCGSYAYAAPEILTGSAYVPQLTDIWSCGVILYVMVYGRLPFDDRDHKKLFKQIRRGPIFHEESNVSKDCQDLISKILTSKENRISIEEIRQHKWFQTYGIRH